MEQQDQGLDMLSVSVERLGQLSLGISEELGQQNKMIDSMETDLDTAAEDLDLVTRKTKEFIKQAGGTKNCIVIMSLSAVALVLFLLVLYS
jgi:t-SNARE complex subunit (syntaxin)